MSDCLNKLLRHSEQSEESMFYILLSLFFQIYRLLAFSYWLLAHSSMIYFYDFAIATSYTVTFRPQADGFNFKSLFSFFLPSLFFQIYGLLAFSYWLLAHSCSIYFSILHSTFRPQADGFN